jgi:hypothetical protein
MVSRKVFQVNVAVMQRQCISEWQQPTTFLMSLSRDKYFIDAEESDLNSKKYLRELNAPLIDFGVNNMDGFLEMTVK